ncbi:Os12g0640400 [Oryza sativa Japonica Group]|uniref:Os12g0640400 protein n=1 Tax=Oryza sativa subsp. japonica TaxID=39947 RepID=A0A0N7KUF8_ORYSJ|nr:Os12g0640400 [Oryza sativa Japonica Group]
MTATTTTGTAPGSAVERPRAHGSAAGPRARGSATDRDDNDDGAWIYRQVASGTCRARGSAVGCPWGICRWLTSGHPRERGSPAGRPRSREWRWLQLAAVCWGLTGVSSDGHEYFVVCVDL